MLCWNFKIIISLWKIPLPHKVLGNALELEYLSCVWLFAAPWTVAARFLRHGIFQARILNGTGVPFPTPGHLPDPGIETASLASPALAGRFFTTSTTWETLWSPAYQYIYLLSSTSVSSVLLFSCSVISDSLKPWTVALQAPWDFQWRNFPWSGPWGFLGKNTGVGCHFLLQGIFLTQGLNPHLLHWQVDSLPLSHQGSPIVVYLQFFQGNL